MLFSLCPFPLFCLSPDIDFSHSTAFAPQLGLSQAANNLSRVFCLFHESRACACSRVKGVHFARCWFETARPTTAEKSIFPRGQSFMAMTFIAKLTSFYILAVYFNITEPRAVLHKRLFSSCILWRSSLISSRISINFLSAVSVLLFAIRPGVSTDRWFLIFPSDE